MIKKCVSSNVIYFVHFLSFQHEYTELRSFSYKDSEVLLLCFSVSDRDSFESVKDFWAPEVKDFLGKRVPIIVVATQTDTRSDLGGDVSTEEGQRMAKEIGAERYLECSCSDQQSVHSVFENVVLTALKQRKRMGNIFRRVLGRWTFWYVTVFGSLFGRTSHASVS